MATEVKIKIEGAIIRKLANADSQARKFVVQGLRDASTQLYEDSLRESPAATGTLRKSMTRDVSESALQATIYPTVGYGIFLHGPMNSSRKRSQPFTIPAREAQPGGSLYRWAKKRGVNPWAIRASIKKRGIAFNPWLERTAREDENKVREIFLGTLQKITAALAD